MTIAGLAFEILICLLLAAAVVACLRVDQRLRALRSGQDGLRDTIVQLNDAVDRARASLAALDRASKDGGAQLKTQVEQAQKLADELRFLNADADGHAHRLTERPRRAPPAPPAPAAPREVDPEAVRSQRRLEALKALR